VEKIQHPDKKVNIDEGSFNRVLTSVFNVIQKQIAETVLVFNVFKKS
jgi:phosphotransacetylase